MCKSTFACVCIRFWDVSVYVHACVLVVYLIVCVCACVGMFVFGGVGACGVMPVYNKAFVHKLASCVCGLASILRYYLYTKIRQCPKQMKERDNFIRSNIHISIASTQTRVLSLHVFTTYIWYTLCIQIYAL